MIVYSYIKESYTHVNKKKSASSSSSSSSFASSSCFCYSFGAVVYIRRARIARDPRDATVARRRRSRTMISFSLTHWFCWTRKREASTNVLRKRIKKNHREKKEENRSTTRPSRRRERDAAGNERTSRSRRYPAKAKRTDAWKRFFKENYIYHESFRC